MAADFLAICDGLRATRDADSCLRGLNAFRKGLRGDEGPAFLVRFLRQSPEWQELQAVWDTQLTVQHYHVTVTLLLTLADALDVAVAAAAAAPPPAPSPAGPLQPAGPAAVLAAGAAGLVAAVLQRRLKALYFCLSSDQRGKANAALTLLTALAAACGSGALAGAAPGRPATGLRDLVWAFDWSLSALPGLARPPREKKGESAADLQRRYWQLWALGDPLKRPSRAVFCQLVLALLRGAGAAGDALLAQQLLQLRPLTWGLLAHLAADPPQQQLEVLQVLQKRVLAPRAGVPAAVQADVFSDAALQQLAAIAAEATTEGDPADEAAGEEEAAAGGAAAAAAARCRQERQAADAGLQVLQAVSTDPAHGLAAPAGPRFALADAGNHQLLAGQRRLLRLLLRLRPADSAAHLQLLLAAAEGDAPLAAALLLALPYSLEPAAAGAAASGGAAGRWFAQAAVAARLLQLLPGLAPAVRGGDAAPAPGGRRAQCLLRCCFPPCMQKAALSRGLQHGNALVRHGTLALLIAAMSALEAVLLGCSTAAAAAPEPACAGWLALRGWLQHAARQQLPDPTLLLALLSAADKQGWEAANELQLTAVLRLLLLWQRALPAALAEAHVDAERLVPQQPLALRPHHQLLLLELLLASADAAAAAAGGDGIADGGAAAAAATTAAALLPPLRLLAGPGVAAGVRAAARHWLLRRLLATGAFGGNPEEAALWLDLMPRGGPGGEALVGFLAEAVQLLLRRPHELHEQQQQLLVAAAAGGAAAAPGPPQFSLLAPCALRQLLRVLPSAKIASEDKAGMAAYVAAVLRQLAQHQLGGCAALAAVLAGLARTEAVRQQQACQPAAREANGTAEQAAGGKKDGKRKLGGGGGSAGSVGDATPLLQLPEGQPLLALLAELEQQQGSGPQAGQEGGKKRKKSKLGVEEQQFIAAAALEANGGTAVAGGAASAAEAAVAAVAAPCQLIARLAASKAADPAALAAIQQRLVDSCGEAGAAGTCSGAVRQCLHLLERRSAACQPALLQVLQATMLAAASSHPEQHRCLQLLAASGLVHGALADGSGADQERQALAAAVVDVLCRALPQAPATAAPCCLPLFEQAAAALQRLEGSVRGDGVPAAARRFLQLLPCMPDAVLAATADALLPALETAQQAAAAETLGGAAAGQPEWLVAVATAVLQQQLASGAWALQAGWLPRACQLLAQLAGSSGAGSTLAAAAGCLLRLLEGRQGAAALAALGSARQEQLLRRCLCPAASDGASLSACSQLASVLVRGSGQLRQLATADLLPALLGGGVAALALALPATRACLQQQQQQRGPPVLPTAAELSLAAAITQPLLAHYTAGSAPAEGVAKQKKKKRRSSEAGQGKPAAPTEAAAPAAAQPLLQQHALPCLRRALQLRPLPAARRAELLASQLPREGWAASAGGGDQAEAAVALLASGGSGASVRELAACVRCLAATLAAVLKLPAGTSELEGRLLRLLDGPVGDAVAALPAAHRSGPAFAELADAAAAGVGTAVLRHRLAVAAAGGAEASAGVVAVRVLRRFLAALLPDEEEEASAAATGSGGDSDSDSSSDEEAARPAAQLRRAASSPGVAEAALQLLQRLLGHTRFLPAMRAAAAAAAACPPPLPAAAAALPRPLASLLPLAAVCDDGDAAEPSAAAAVAAELKKELCELLETLLDLHERYSGSDTGSTASRPQQQLVQAAEAALLPLLMAGYGASCSSADAAAWSLAAAINRRQWRRRCGAVHGGLVGAEAEAAKVVAEDGDMAALAALLHGPLADSCFAWGPAAVALQAAAAADGEPQQQQRLQLLRQRLPLDPARAALTVCHWPEACSLAAPGSAASDADTSSSAAGDAGTWASDGGRRDASSLAQLPGCAAVYDPGFLLPFCCAGLRAELLPPRAFAEAGLLSVCLRGLAAADPGCRAAAYQALALFEAQLGAAAAPDFRERRQLSVLLGALRAAVVRPFQRLPAVHAVFLAEAALVALHPGTAMYPTVNRQLSRRAVLSTTDVPLLGQLLLAGGQQHIEERRWVMQLLLAGLRTAEDGALYRRQHVAELAMGLHDSCVAEPEAAALALRLLCTATFLPRAARQLAHESGLIPWLATAAAAAMAQRHAGDGVAAPLRALRRLLRLRGVMQGGGGAAAARQMVTAARQLAAAATAGGSGAAAACRDEVLPFLFDVQRMTSQQLGLEGISAAASALASPLEAAQAGPKGRRALPAVAT